MSRIERGALTPEQNMQVYGKLHSRAVARFFRPKSLGDMEGDFQRTEELLNVAEQYAKEVGLQAHPVITGMKFDRHYLQYALQEVRDFGKVRAVGVTRR